MRWSVSAKAKSRAKVASMSIFAWAVVVGTGLFALAKYEATPGPAAQGDTSVAVMPAKFVSPGKMTLVMFVHPKCPCSEASLQELSELMTNYGNRLSATVVVFQPSRRTDEWSTSTLWREAAEIPGVMVRSDVDAILAKKCAAQTSGQTFLYDEKGRLVFEGGITGSRGHVGDNDGLEAVIGLASGRASADAPRAFAPVFGCPIYGCSESRVKSSLASVMK